MVHRPAKEPKQPRNEHAVRVRNSQNQPFSPSAGLDHILRRKTVQWELQGLRQPPQDEDGTAKSATAGWVRIAEQAAEEATA